MATKLWATASGLAPRVWIKLECADTIMVDAAPADCDTRYVCPRCDALDHAAGLDSDGLLESGPFDHEGPQVSE